MSVKIMSAVFESETLAPTERLIMLALADHADDTGRCYPSISRLGRRTGLSERAVQTNIRKLVNQGYIRVIAGGGKNNTNVYFVSANPAADAPCTKCTPAADAPQTPQQMRPNPAADAPEPSGTVTKPSEEPLLIPPREKSKRATSISDDWKPSQKNIADAHKQNLTDWEIENESEKFRDYHKSRGTKFKDWDAGWRTWIRNSREFAARSAPRRQQPQAGQQFSGLAGAAMRSRVARQQGYEG